MSKGSSYWSTARGKIGNTVVSIVRGQRIEKAYQPVVNNPRTDAQMKQRARFANVVKFYKNATAQFFRFAFEDRKQTESEFNAFMRWNTNDKASILKYEQVKGNFPAVGNNYILTAGSLGEISYAYGNQSILYLPLPSLAATKNNIGELSTALMSDFNLEAGDIVTLVKVATSVSSLTQANPTLLPKWTIKQFTVEPSSVALLSSIDPNLSLTSGEGLYLDSSNRSTAYWYGVIFSRQTTNGVKVSVSPLTGNTIASSLYKAATVSSWIAEAINSWGATGEAILQGSLVTKSVTGVIETVSGDAIPRVSDTTLGAGVSSSAIVTGQNLKSVNASDFSGQGISNIQWYAESDTQGTLTITGKGDYPNSWILYYQGQVIAQHSLVEATITSVSPSSTDVLGAADSITLTIEGTGVDALKESDFVVSDSNLSLSIGHTTQDGGTSIVMVVTASAEVSAATISYKDNVIFEITESSVTFGDVVSVSGYSSATANLTGTGLNTLTAKSFTLVNKEDEIGQLGNSIKSYTPSADGTTATMVISIENDGYVKYGDKTIVNVTYTSGNID